ncbi:hypothetical protein PENTCL1PPCAC_5180, partial [Pristionchus entomophagus]
TIRPRNLNSIQIPICSDFIDFLLHSAETVEEMMIMTPSERQTPPKPKLLPLVLEILNRKCSRLHLSNVYNASSHGDTEILLQCFHHMEKRVRFRALIVAESADFVIGNYAVSI